MNGIEIAEIIIAIVIVGLVFYLFFWSLGAAIGSLFKSKFALNVIRLLAFLILVLLALRYLPK